MTSPALPVQGSPSRGRRSSRPSGDDRESAILLTAERLLAERPLTDISVDDLAKGAGISRPTFYFYFASKDAVLMTLLDRVVQEVESKIDTLRDSFPADPVF
jgi:AcrR family transcriptional regulator